MVDPLSRRRRFRRIAAAVLLAVCAVPSAWLVRHELAEARYDDVIPITTTPSYEDPALIERAWRLPVARAFDHHIVWQSNGSFCGPASVANVLRSLGRQATERSVLEGTGVCITGLCFGGLSLDELAQVVRHAGYRATTFRDLSLDELRAHLRASNDPGVRYIVNFHRGPLFGHGGGHFSPIGGYLEERDLVFVLDVNEDYDGPWLVSSERLLQTIDTIDPATDKRRGLLRIELPAGSTTLEAR